MWENIFLVSFAGTEHVKLTKNVINGKTMFLGSKNFFQIMETKNIYKFGSRFLFVNARKEYLRKVIYISLKRKRREKLQHTQCNPTSGVWGEKKTKTSKFIM